MMELIAMNLLVNSPAARWNSGESAGELRAAAEVAMAAEFEPVTAKKRLPPGAGPHDYVSQGPYWWPDPSKPDGLPYVWRDGEVNPECTEDSDRRRLDALASGVAVLASARVRLGDAAAGVRAAALLRMFFIDAATRMNPNLDFGQGIPGHCTGRGIGVIETRVLAVTLVDAIQILHATGDLPDSDYAALRGWFSDYLDWLLTSPIGSAEGREANNHGTAYDLQVAVFAIFAGRDELARATLEGVLERRVAKQVEPDGSQPRELARTRSFSYSTMNMGLYHDLAAVAKRFGIDLWNASTADGRSIAKAAEWLRPYIEGEKEWTRKQIVPFDPSTVRWTIARP